MNTNPPRLALDVVDSDGASIHVGAQLDVRCVIHGSPVLDCVTVDALIPDPRRGPALVWMRVVPDDVDQDAYSIRASGMTAMGGPRHRVNRAAADPSDAYVTVRSTPPHETDAA